MLSQFTHAIIILSAIVGNLIAIKRFAYDNKFNTTCDNYILNTYLYVLLGFLLTSLFILLTFESKMVNNLVMNTFSSWLSIIIFIVLYYGSLILFNKVNPKNNIQLHLMWLVLILFFSILLYFPIKLSVHMNFLSLAIGITLVLVSILSYVGIKYGKDLIKHDWDIYLRYGLFALIIIYFLLPLLMPLLIKLGLEQNTIYIILSLISIIVFSLLIMSYNKKLNERSRLCYKNNNPNYPQESVGLIVKIMNILIDIINLLGRNSRSRK